MIISEFLSKKMTLTYAGMMALIFFGGAASCMVIAADQHSAFLYSISCTYAAVGVIFTAFEIRLSQKHIQELESRGRAS